MSKSDLSLAAETVGKALSSYPSMSFGRVAVMYRRDS